jgi:hypothetical protein
MTPDEIVTTIDQLDLDRSEDEDDGSISEYSASESDYEEMHDDSGRIAASDKKENEFWGSSTGKLVPKKRLLDE